MEDQRQEKNMIKLLYANSNMAIKNDQTLAAIVEKQSNEHYSSYLLERKYKGTYT
mgnify:CR=1 FL=1